LVKKTKLVSSKLSEGRRKEKKFHPSSLRQPQKAEKRPHKEVERLLLERRRSFSLYKERGKWLLKGLYYINIWEELSPWPFHPQSTFQN
jgi:phosphorylcholine metabolism protein LicD